MSSKAYWTVNGTKIENSTNAFMKAVKTVSNAKNLKKYEGQLNKTFKTNIQTNMRQAGIGDKHFDDAFFLRITNGSIVFTNTEPLITQRYEYGYYDGNDKNNDEYYDEAYMIETSPRYFIRPAIQKTIEEVGNIMLQEANEVYRKNCRQSNGDDVY